MKYLSWIVSVPLTLVILLFVLSNSESVSLSLWPFITTITAPLYIFFILTVFVSFFSGFILMWLMQHPYRAAARKWQKQAEKLQAVVLEPTPASRAITDVSKGI